MTRVMTGKTNKDMARELGVSPRTIEVHRGRLMTKLGADSVADLVRLGLNTRAVLAPKGSARYPSSQTDPPKKTPQASALKKAGKDGGALIRLRLRPRTPRRLPLLLNGRPPPPPKALGANTEPGDDP